MKTLDELDELAPCAFVRALGAMPATCTGSR
jgi:hypothetical protein